MLEDVLGESLTISGVGAPDLEGAGDGLQSTGRRWADGVDRYVVEGLALGAVYKKNLAALCQANSYAQ